MNRLGVREARARLFRVVRRAERGKETVITRRGVPVARVVPIRPADAARWDRSEVIDRIVEFSRNCRIARKDNLQSLVEEGRLKQR